MLSLNSAHLQLMEKKISISNIKILKKNVYFFFQRNIFKKTELFSNLHDFENNCEGAAKKVL